MLNINWYDRLLSAKSGRLLATAANPVEPFGMTVMSHYIGSKLFIYFRGHLQMFNF
ncbi:hypothetical protein SAMN05216248_11387 [Pseudomonas simiae]|nr:hypothetical protein SAMN05216248_11387 [Pseudomonas simiae]